MICSIPSFTFPVVLALLIMIFQKLNNNALQFVSKIYLTGLGLSLGNKKHLFPLSAYRGIPILNPTDFLRRVK